MEISVIGAGHVGLVTGACFAALGHNVVMVDNDPSKLERLKKGDVWFYEPGLEDLVHKGVKEGRLSFTSSIKEAVEKTQVIFISVGTPPKPDGEADLTIVEHVAREIAAALKDEFRLVVEKSTVPVQTGEWVHKTLKGAVKANVEFDVASNPEFLREGTAVEDFMKPDRIVVGVQSEQGKKLLRELYSSIDAPLLITDVKSAELIKHASNSFLAMKISFINAVSQVCDIVGADVIQVADGMGLDKRINRKFLNAGIGYGGSCFPKDVSAFISIADKIGYDFTLLKAVSEINEQQKRYIVKKISAAMWNLKGKKIGVLGLAFKPDTDDLRDAPQLDVMKMILAEQATIQAFDPKAMDHAKELLPEGVTFCEDAYAVAKDADCLVVLTEWEEFKQLDLQKLKSAMRQPIMVDGRNLFDPETVIQAGFRYTAIGRGINIED